MLSSLAISAQTTLTEGFYRVQNHISKRYLYVRDCTGDISSLGADMGSIELWLGQENAISDPSCIMYFSKHSSAWDIQSQATGVYELTGHYMTISLFAGGYTVYNSGQYLYDITKNNTTPRGKLGAKTDKEMSGYTGYKVWDVLPVNSATDQYFGLKPTISASGAYYTTFYADFAFTPQSENTKVWCVTTVDKKNGIAVIKQMNGTIPRSQPVIIQSSSPEPSKNRVDLANAGGTAPSANKLTGVYFSNGDRSFEVHTGDPAYVEWNPQTMRLLGKDSNGKLAFTNNPADLVQTEIDPGTGTWRDAKVIPHNQAYLKVEAGCPATLQIMTEEEYNAYIASQQTFTLTYKVDGEVYKKYTMKAGDAITPEPAPTKTGYTFSGWSDIPKVMPAQDITISGTFSINSYKLTYLVDGQQYKQYTVKYGETITPEAAPTKTGYTFSGWSNLPTTMPDHDVTVSGSFTVNSYTLTYMVDGAVYKTFTLNYGTPITPEVAPTKEGYTFSGWSEIPTAMPDHDVTITGSFSINSYTIIYLYEGTVVNRVTLEYDEEIPEYTYAPESTQEMEYTFLEWLEDGVSFTLTRMPDRDVVLTASVDSTPTDIRTITQTSASPVIFDLNGRRVTTMKPGTLYLVNGKKYLHK